VEGTCKTKIFDSITCVCSDAFKQLGLNWMIYIPDEKKTAHFLGKQNVI